MSACPLQTVLSDFEDASKHLEDDAKDVKREIQLVADSLRLGGAILGEKLNFLSKLEAQIQIDINQSCEKLLQFLKIELQEVLSAITHCCCHS